MTRETITKFYDSHYLAEQDFQKMRENGWTWVSQIDCFDKLEVVFVKDVK